MQLYFLNIRIFFIIKEDEIEGLLYEYSKQNLNYKNISKNEFEKPFRKLHYINSDKFLMASYTLKEKENKITGMNKMCIIDNNNFQIKKSYDIKISPIKNSIETYKNKYLIFSYFTTIEAVQGNEEEDNNDPYYSFDGNYYNEVFHNLEKKVYNDNYYYDDYYYYNYHDRFRYVKYYDDYENKYYSYDIKQHYIGIYSIKYEEFIIKIEFDLMKRVYNINDNLICLFVRNGLSYKNTQITYERIFQENYNDIPLMKTPKADNYKKENFLSYTLLDIGFNVLKGNVDYDNITCIKEINQNFLVIYTEKKGITLYN